jgi:hypothetical protein
MYALATCKYEHLVILFTFLADEFTYGPWQTLKLTCTFFSSFVEALGLISGTSEIKKRKKLSMNEYYPIVSTKRRCLLRPSLLRCFRLAYI